METRESLSGSSCTQSIEALPYPSLPGAFVSPLDRSIVPLLLGVAMTADAQAKAMTQLNLTRITETLIRKRAEHNEGMVSTLEEVALHQQNLGRIEALGQLCPRLKILYLQNNLISKLQNLHKLKVI
jgi:uncharacterized protein involved in propanediol utilization